MAELTKSDRDMLIETHTIVKRLDKSVNGNGVPGLVSRQATIEATLKEHLKKHNQWPVVLSSVCALAAVVIAYIALVN